MGNIIHILNMANKKKKIVNKGRGPQPLTERNEKLAKDYKDGKPMFDIVSKYKISPKRIYEILDGMGIPRDRKPTTEAKPFYEGQS